MSWHFSTKTWYASFIKNGEGFEDINWDEEDEYYDEYDEWYDD